MTSAIGGRISRERRAARYPNTLLAAEGDNRALETNRDHCIAQSVRIVGFGTLGIVAVDSSDTAHFANCHSFRSLRYMFLTKSFPTQERRTFLHRNHRCRHPRTNTSRTN